MASDLIDFRAKWRGNEYTLPKLDVKRNKLIDLKQLLSDLVDVSPECQKIIGLSKSALFKLNDEMLLGDIPLKLSGDICSFVLMGAPESEKESSASTIEESSAREVVNDLSLEYGPASKIWQKLQKHAQECEIHFITAARPDKKLLVLDLDHTLLDFTSKASDVTAEQMKRPYLDQFLTICYAHYDLAIWSQTSWRWLEIKLFELGLATSESYKLCFCLDKTTMFRAANKEYVKPLALIFTKNPKGINWGLHNTLHIDDLSRNFALNPKSGITIAPYHRAALVSTATATTAHDSEVRRGSESVITSLSATSISTQEQPPPSSDIELALLTKYLSEMAALNDVSSKDHSNWRSEVIRMLENGGKKS